MHWLFQRSGFLLPLLRENYFPQKVVTLNPKVLTFAAPQNYGDQPATFSFKIGFSLRLPARTPIEDQFQFFGITTHLSLHINRHPLLNPKLQQHCFWVGHFGFPFGGRNFRLDGSMLIPLEKLHYSTVTLITNSAIFFLLLKVLHVLSVKNHLFLVSSLWQLPQFLN